MDTPGTPDTPTTSKRRRHYPIGTTFEKLFEGDGWYKGEVCRYKKLKLENGNIVPIYEIHYEDGDQEDLDEKELAGRAKTKIRKLLKPSAASIDENASGMVPSKEETDFAADGRDSSTSDVINLVANATNESDENSNDAVKEEETIAVKTDGSTIATGLKNDPISVDDDESHMPVIIKSENSVDDEKATSKTEDSSVVSTEQHPPTLTIDPAPVAPITPEKEQDEPVANTGANIAGGEENTTADATAAAVPIKEETHKKFAAVRKESYRKYGDRFLLHRHLPMGIARLGGNLQKTYVVPAKGHSNLQDHTYPKPNNPECHEDYGYCAYNTTWQPNGPMFAGQQTAAVDGLPPHFLEPGSPSFPVFMKRTRTGKDSKRQGLLLGWEYVGNYRSIHDHEVPFWESANNFTEASKKEIADKLFKSSLNENGWGRSVLDRWRNRLIEAVEDESEPHPVDSLAARCLQLGFQPEMPDKNLSELLMSVDEYHKQYMIQFESYDERIYNYCVEGRTNSTKSGKTIRKGSKDTPAKAQDWYDFAEANMIFKY